MKRYVIVIPKHSSSINDETKQDIISKLPETLLIHILSMLPDADACRTSILSKKWRDLWMFLPNLHLIMPPWPYETKEQVGKFCDLVDKTLAVRDGMSIQNFLLRCFKSCDYDRVLHWLRIVVQCKVEILVLRFPTEFLSKLCWDLFKTCNTLVDLTLEGDSTLDVPKADVIFPCLKKISLIHRFPYSRMNLWPESFENLITGCPVLEELSLKGYAPTDNLRELTRYPSSQSFQRIEICSKRMSKIEVVIYKYHCMKDYCVFPTHIVAKPLSFVEVYVSEAHCGLGGFPYMAEARILTLTNSSLEALILHGLNKFVWLNVVKLTIDNISNWNSLLALLNNMPNLEHITFSNGISHNNLSWIPPMEPPACVCLKMKEIIILNRKTVSYEEFAFVRFLLKHSKNLERLRINAHVLDPMRRKQLLNFHHGLCRIEIV